MWDLPKRAFSTARAGTVIFNYTGARNEVVVPRGSRFSPGSGKRIHEPFVVLLEFERTPLRQVEPGSLRRMQLAGVRPPRNMLEHGPAKGSVRYLDEPSLAAPS